MRLRRTISKKLGNTFFTSLLFLFILATTLRVCTNKTLQECKLTNIFIQETQTYYLLENLMALSRDYAHQLTQNPMMPNLFLSVFAYRDKDKSSGQTGTIIDFNGSLSKEQIVPNDFPLQISTWDIKGGPIFWQDKKKNENDERHLAEVFMLGELAIDSNLVPGWKARMVQTMEIERNPLCDFQLYSEGDTLINDNIWSDNLDSWHIYFYGPIQINGNTRFQLYGGFETASSLCQFENKVNLAGHVLRIDETGSASAKSIKIPEKYCFYDTSEFYDNFTNPYTTASRTFKVNTYNVAHIGTFTVNLSKFSNTTLDTKFSNYEQYAFNEFNGNFMTRSRVYRPCGFDPISDWGFWYPEENGGSSANARVLDMCLGLHNLCKSSSLGSHLLYGENTSYATNTRPAQAASDLRGLDKFQMTEKARLVESQKVINGPGLEVRLLLKNADIVNKDSLRIPINFPYVTYNKDHFPAKNDQKYLTWYFKLKFQENSIFEDLGFNENSIDESNDKIYYEFEKDETPVHQFDISSYGSQGHPQTIQKNKLVVQTTNCRELPVDDTFESIFITKKGFDQVAYNDPSSPPHKLIEKVDSNGMSYWTLDSTQMRLHTSSNQGYQFIYDRNRAKWIQLMDIDVSALTAAVAANKGVFSGWKKKLNCTIKINVYWQGFTGNANTIGGNANTNYKDWEYEGDIRLKYISKRETFLANHGNGAYLYSSDLAPVIDVGVRLINAEEIPDGGMTILCPYPLYLKGDFNTVNMKPKACIITDSLTVLSKDWQDWRSGMDFFNSYLYSMNGKEYDPIVATAPKIYAHIITGRTHPNYWLKDNGIFPDFGIHDAIRTLEDMHAPINIYGSVLLPYYCQRQWEPPINLANASRVFSYAPLHLGTGEWLSMRTAPGMPTYLRVNRGRKTQTIGAKVYNTLINNVCAGLVDSSVKDASNYNFADYHASLPNFLKYPQDPASQQ